MCAYYIYIYIYTQKYISVCLLLESDWFIKSALMENAFTCSTARQHLFTRVAYFLCVLLAENGDPLPLTNHQKKKKNSKREFSNNKLLPRSCLWCVCVFVCAQMVRVRLLGVPKCLWFTLLLLSSFYARENVPASMLSMLCVPA